MYFLIDFENVKELGFTGVEYLEKEDVVSVFYSENCNKLNKYFVKYILDSKCGLEIFQRITHSKNANDFCIASRVGEILATEPFAKIGIISCDKGFKAVVDYWVSRMPYCQISLAPTITSSICRVKGEVSRKEKIKNEVSYIPFNAIAMEVSGMNNFRNSKKVQEFLRKNGHDNECEKILKTLGESKSLMELYRLLVKELGRNKGIEMYRLLKNSGIPMYLGNPLSSYV